MEHTQYLIPQLIAYNVINLRIILLDLKYFFQEFNTTESQSFPMRDKHETKQLFSTAIIATNFVAVKSFFLQTKIFAIEKIGV